MSWITQHLLRNSVSIKSSPDIESDEYNNLLVIESKINALHDSGFLSDIDLWIIELMADGKPIKNLEAEVGKNRITISKTFIQICDRISYLLGGYFTDDGFLDNMRESYNLDDAQIEKLKEYMSGKFKNKLMKKNNGETTNEPR